VSFYSSPLCDKTVAMIRENRVTEPSSTRNIPPSVLLSRQILRRPAHRGTYISYVPPFDVRRSMFDVGCWMLDVGCWMFPFRILHSAFFLPPKCQPIPADSTGGMAPRSPYSRAPVAHALCRRARTNPCPSNVVVPCRAKSCMGGGPPRRWTSDFGLWTFDFGL